ncbi:glutathione S-transferase C-terminal domain-containing protein homolog [Homarus americanus]|nr:glutathione S-transferase C-terminal domain-containing protein homolog [Homarus americanus]
MSFGVIVKEEKDCPDMIGNCMLPAILMTSQPWCVAGLCSSLRFILNRTLEIHPEHYCRQLLGFRGGCLQACAEVSVWTKFCEVETLETLKNVFRDRYCNTAKIELPRDIMRYEHHMQHPPILHNALKRKQEYIRNTVHDKNEQQELCQKKLAQLPQLEHKFAEGLDMTLADVILYASFHIIITKLQIYMTLEDVIPLVIKWYEFISSNSYIQRALPVLQKTLASISAERKTGTTLEIVIPEVPHESIYKSDPERYKPRWRAFTHQEDIEKVLGVLEVAAVKPTYDVHPSDSISLSWSSFPSAVSPQEGQLPLSRLQRKCQQLENVVSAILSVSKPGDVIVDFCAGGGHVGIVVAYSLPDCKVLLVENKEASLLRAKKRVETLELKNVEFVQCNLDYFKGRFNVGVSLHACGVATDLVMLKCLQQKAAFICSPCCYGGVQPNHILDYPRSQIYRNMSLSLSEYLTLGHAADQTHDENNPKTEQGQLCMKLIDTDRLMLAQSLGYDTRLVLMQPKTCSPKNHLLIGELKEELLHNI